MTAPVVVKVVDKSFWERGVYTMSFLLPAEYQANPPKPTDSKVSFSGTEKHKHSISYNCLHHIWTDSLKHTSSQVGNKVFANLQVYIHKTPDMKVYVQGYGGWLTQFSDKNTASKLSSALNSAGAEYKKGFHYAVGFNRWANHHFLSYNEKNKLSLKKKYLMIILLTGFILQ